MWHLNNFIIKYFQTQTMADYVINISLKLIVKI